MPMKNEYHGGEAHKLKKAGQICNRCEIIFDDEDFAEYEHSGICKQCVKEMATGKVEISRDLAITRSPMTAFDSIYEDGDSGGRKGRTWENG